MINKESANKIKELLRRKKDDLNKLLSESEKLALKIAETRSYTDALSFALSVVEEEAKRLQD